MPLTMLASQAPTLNRDLSTLTGLTLLDELSNFPNDNLLNGFGGALDVNNLALLVQETVELFRQDVALKVEV